MLGARVGRLRLPLGRIRRQRGDDVVDAARDPAAVIAGLEAGRDGVGDDEARHRVGQRALEFVADLDPHPPLLRRDEEKNAVILLGFAELPRTEEFVGVGLDLFAPERGDGRDHQLDAGFCSSSASLRSRSATATGERICASSTTRPVSAGKFAASAAAIHSAAMRAAIGARGQKRGIRALPSEDQNFTFGAACASASAVNGTSGLVERNTVSAQSTVGKVLSEVLKSCTAAM